MLSESLDLEKGNITSKEYRGDGQVGGGGGVVDEAEPLGLTVLAREHSLIQTFVREHVFQ